MENYAKENGTDEVLNNCKRNYHRDVMNGEVDLKSRSRESSKSRESNKSYKFSHEDLLLDNELANDTDINDAVNNKVNHDVKNKDLVSKSFKEIFETNSTKDVPNKLSFVNKYDDLAPNLSSPDSDDLFDSCKKNINQSTTIVHNVYNNSGGSGVLSKNSSDVSNANNRSSDNKTNISNQPNVIQTNTQQSFDNSQKTINNTQQSIDSSHQSINSTKKDSNATGNNGNISDLVEKVNTLNSHMSPKVVFHTPKTTPLKLKLNSLPVQSHPLDDHALDLSPDESYRNEPLDFPSSPVLNKTIDEICLKRYKRSCGSALGQNPLSVEETKQATELNCIKTSPASIRGSRSPDVTLRKTSPAQGSTSASASFESVILGKTSPINTFGKNSSSISNSTTAGDFTNNVSAESYLKKYDDINAQVRAYLNKTASESKLEIDALNERSHRYLNTASIDDLENLTGANKVIYVSDEEDTSLYDTIVSQDCHGVKLVKNPRKPSSLPTTAAAQSSGKKKKLILTSDLFSGNLLDDDLKSMSDQDLDELLTPSNADDDIENSILEQLNLSEDDDDVESIQELSAKEEREESRKWKICIVNGVEKRIDMKVIEPYKRVLSHGGYLNSDCHNAIIVFSACFLPHHSRADYHYVMDNLFFYVLHTLDQLITEDYVLVYLHGATSRHNMPTFSWLKRCYQMIDRKLKKNLKQLYLVHATFWLKTIILMSKPFISGKFSKKIQFIMSLTELNEKLATIEEASIPDKVRQYDKIKLSMTSSQQHE
ncbi:hypothetical protein WDU94_003321 [Cyamophila willieti]